MHDAHGKLTTTELLYGLICLLALGGGALMTLDLSQAVDLAIMAVAALVVLAAFANWLHGQHADPKGPVVPVPPQDPRWDDEAYQVDLTPAPVQRTVEPSAEEVYDWAQQGDFAQPQRNAYELVSRQHQMWSEQ